MSAPLDVVQRWMQAVITHPDGVAAGVQSPGAQAEISGPRDASNVVLPSQQRSTLQRLEVYAHAYYARLLECMRNMFPAMVYTLEEELFNDFAFEYLQTHPPSSYTLNRLADNFIQFLRDTRPRMTGDDASDGPSWPDFLIDLARLEQRIDTVFDGPGFEGSETLRAEELAAIPPDAWPAARLKLAVCVELMEFQFPVNDYYSSYREDAPVEVPPPEATYLAVTRRDFIVRRLPLTAAQFQLLTVLQQGGAIGEAIEAAAAASDDLDQLAAQLHGWFAHWSREQLFASVEIT